MLVIEPLEAARQSLVAMLTGMGLPTEAAEDGLLGLGEGREGLFEATNAATPAVETSTKTSSEGEP